MYWITHIGIVLVFWRTDYISQSIMAQLIQRYGSDNIHFIDGFPLPVCGYTRARKHKNFKEYVGFSYCAAKQEKYYAFQSSYRH